MSHFYRPDGSTLYEVPDKSKRVKCPECGGNMRGDANKAVTAACDVCDDGGYVYPEMRDATLRDARQCAVGWGCTEVISTAAAPDLVNWAQNQRDLAILTSPKLREYASGSMSLEDQKAFLAEIDKSAEEAKNSAADEGTEIHRALEKWTKGEEVEPRWRALCESVGRCLDASGLLWPTNQAESTFFHPLGYGCAIDLRNPEIGFVLDFKSKDWEAGGKAPRAWPNMAMQLAANREAAGMPKADCYNLFISRQDHTLVSLHKWSELDLQVAWTKFNHLLAYLKLDTGYNPGLGA